MFTWVPLTLKKIFFFQEQINIHEQQMMRPNIRTD